MYRLCVDGKWRDVDDANEFLSLLKANMSNETFALAQNLVDAVGVEHLQYADAHEEE